MTIWSQYTFSYFYLNFDPYVTLTLAAGTYLLRTTLCLTIVNICAKLSLYACRIFAPDKRFFNDL
jgi:hypothetical protein